METRREIVQEIKNLNISIDKLIESKRVKEIKLKNIDLESYNDWKKEININKSIIVFGAQGTFKTTKINSILSTLNPKNYVSLSWRKFISTHYYNKQIVYVLEDIYDNQAMNIIRRFNDSQQILVIFSTSSDLSDVSPEELKPFDVYNMNDEKDKQLK